MSPGTGRVFSPELLLLSPDGRLVLVYTVPTSSNEGAQQRQQEDRRQLEGKQLELRRVETEEEEGSHGCGRRHAPREARVVFEELCGPQAAAHPSFFLDASRFVHLHVSRIVR